MASSYKAIIFDFDFTLVDPSIDVVECVNYALSRMALPMVSKKMACRTVGLSLGQAFIQLTGIEQAEKEAQFSQLFLERADEISVDSTPFLSGIPDVVESLRRRGLKLGIVSAKTRGRIAGLLDRERLLSKFEVIVGREDVTHQKPHPEGLLLALSRLECRVDEVVFVGDSVSDCQAARRAGLDFVAVLTGVTERHEFDDCGPRAVLRSVAELPQMISNRDRS